jgi:hypothetical protein
MILQNCLHFRVLSCNRLIWTEWWNFWRIHTR